MKKNISILLFLCCCSPIAHSQLESTSADSDERDTEIIQRPVPVKIFPSTRLIDGSSTTNLAGGVLDFRISHRFGRLNDGSQNFFGLDNATTRIGLDYGITKWLMIGLGHSTLDKEDDGFLKIKLLNQKHNSSPVALCYFGGMSAQTAPAPILPAGDKWLYRYRLSYVHQLLVARQFGNWLSLQLMPSLIHYNIVDSNKNDNNTFAIGVGGRVKLNKRLALTGEYFYRLNNTDIRYNSAPTYNALSLGFEIESGGHVFQLLFTNAQGLTERNFIGQTTDRWEMGQMHFGFNISRVFAIAKPKEYVTQ